MDTPALSMQHLSKRYPRTKTFALRDVSLAVMPGEVYGFLGSNGAGKSTAIRTALNFLQPTEGSAAIAGLDSVTQSVEAKRHVGYLAGEIALYPKLTGHDFLQFMQRLQPLKHPAYYKSLVKLFDLDIHKPIGTLSKGNRQKVGLIQALMHEPAVLILDEPTSGLDPLMQDVFFDCITEAKQRGCAVFVSSHNFSEVLRMCDRVGFLKEGKLIAEQSITALAKQAAHTFGITFGTPAPVAELKAVKGLKLISHNELRATVALQGELAPLFAVLARHTVTGFTQQEVNLEDTFLHFYRGGKA